MEQNVPQVSSCRLKNELEFTQKSVVEQNTPENIYTKIKNGLCPTWQWVTT